MLVLSFISASLFQAGCDRRKCTKLNKRVYRSFDWRSCDRCSLIHCPLIVPMSRSLWAPSRLIHAQTPTASTRTDPTTTTTTTMSDMRHRDRLSRAAQIHASRPSPILAVMFRAGAPLTSERTQPHGNLAHLVSRPLSVCPRCRRSWGFPAFRLVRPGQRAQPL